MSWWWLGEVVEVVVTQLEACHVSRVLQGLLTPLVAFGSTCERRATVSNLSLVCILMFHLGNSHVFWYEPKLYIRMSIFQDSADQDVCIRTEEPIKGIWDMFDLHESHSLETKLIMFAFEYVAMGILVPLRPY